MGEDSFAQGIFPPPPSVMHGVLRSVFVSQKLEGGHFTETGIQSSAALKLRFLALQIGVDCWFPKPADLLVLKKKKEARLLQLMTKPKYSNAATPEVLVSTSDEKTEDEPHLVGAATLENYLNGGAGPFGVKPLNEAIVREAKIGIGRNSDTNSAEEGNLYRVFLNRPMVENLERLKFLLGFDVLGLSSKGWMALGGERRVAYFAEGEASIPPCPKLEENRFKIYLSTAAVFEHGWKPENLLKKHGLKLVTAALGRTQHIGGWDLEKTLPKTMVQAVPAGSVYYVEAKSKEAAQAAADAIHDHSISDNLNNTDYGAQGFGIAYVGKIAGNS
jgi:CRISPR-associated protein Cmr3